MSSKADRAVGLFRNGFLCSQAVFAVFSEDGGLKEELALRIGNGFGGGIAGRQDVCGAVAGAVMVIGLKAGKDDADDRAAHRRTYEMTDRFCERFEELHGTIRCLDLLGCDHDTAGKRDLYATRCTGFVRDAVHLLEEICGVGKGP